jgi:phage/plasmid-like protein (TIGR03299 family)
MAHNIENNMIAWKGEKPWHGLGFEVPANATGEEMLVIAGLNWLVQRRHLAMRPSNGDTSVMLTSELDDYRAIVRSDTNQVFTVASDRYHPVQNAEIVDFFREFCNAGHASMETVGGLRNGAVVWALAKLNGGSTATLQGVDELRGYMLLATSHDGSLVTVGKPTQTRVVCWNTLSAALGLSGGRLKEKEQREFRMKHTRNFGTTERSNAQKIMGMAIQQIQATNELANELSQVHIDAAGRLQFIDRLLDGKSLLDTAAEETVSFSSNASILDAVISNGHSVHTGNPEEKLNRVGKAILEAMLTSPGSDLPTAKDTLWGAINGITYYADHSSKARSDSNRMFSSWFGPNETLKNRAVQVAVDMAGIKVAQA